MTGLDKSRGLGDELRIMVVYLDGQYVDSSEAKVSVFDHGLLYGDGVFEGIRAYNGRVFKLRSHMKRMYCSAERIRLKPAYPMEQVEQAIRDTLNANGMKDAYIRLIFTRGAGTLGLHPFRCPVTEYWLVHPGPHFVEQVLILSPEHESTVR